MRRWEGQAERVLDWAAVEQAVFTSMLITAIEQNDLNYMWIFFPAYFHTYANMHCFICGSKIATIISDYWGVFGLF